MDHRGPRHLDRTRRSKRVLVIGTLTPALAVASLLAFTVPGPDPDAVAADTVNVALASNRSWWSRASDRPWSGGWRGWSGRRGARASSTGTTSQPVATSAPATSGGEPSAASGSPSKATSTSNLSAESVQPTGMPSLQSATPSDVTSSSYAPRSSSAGTTTSSADRTTASSAPAGTWATPASGGFPNAGNTGVPAGTPLQPYTGPCDITSDRTIDAKTISCTLRVLRGTLTVTRSKINGSIDNDDNGSVNVSDSEIDGRGAGVPAIGYRNMTVRRSNLHGAKDGVNCADNCDIRDSYLHVESIPSGASWHMQGFLSNGASDVTLIHNTLFCDAPTTRSDGGCTAALSIFGDFSGNHRYEIRNNLFKASDRVSYCTYGGYDPGKRYGRDVSDVVFQDNVYERGPHGKCGAYGPATAFEQMSGNVWSNNRYVDGAEVRP